MSPRDDQGRHRKAYRHGQNSGGCSLRHRRQCHMDPVHEALHSSMYLLTGRPRKIGQCYGSCDVGSPAHFIGKLKLR
jgi:hypothetical protein